MAMVFKRKLVREGKRGEQNTNKAISLNLKTKLIRKERYFPAGVG
jgi:hypothetical protein